PGRRAPPRLGRTGGRAAGRQPRREADRGAAVAHAAAGDRADPGDRGQERGRASRADLAEVGARRARPARLTPFVAAPFPGVRDLLPPLVGGGAARWTGSSVTRDGSP